MRFVISIVGYAIALSLCGCANGGVKTDSKNSFGTEFVGSTPGEALAREFLGGLASNAPCHSITWRVTLLTNQHTGQPSTFSLAARYRIPTRHNTNQSQDGPRVAVHGTWEILNNAQTKAVVYRIDAAEPRRSLSFVRVGDSLLHLLNPDGSFAIGNGGASYTLNRADHAEKPGDMSLVNSAPSVSYKISPLATGATVFGVFEGRTPCQGISRELKVSQPAGCIKAKWRVTLYRNPETSIPTTYKIEGSLFRHGAREGTWSIRRGAVTDPDATVYQLSPAQGQPALFLLKADDSVLFFLNQNREPMIGHAEFSYTLNRVAAK